MKVQTRTGNRVFDQHRLQRAVPLDFVTVQAFDAYELERLTVPRAASSDFVLVSLFRAGRGADAAGRGQRPDHRRRAAAGLARPVTPHQLRHAFITAAQGRGVASECNIPHLA